MIRRASLAALSLVAISLTGCGVLSTLDTIVTATEAAIPILQAAGVPIPPQVPGYVADVAQCIATQGSVTTPTSAQLAAISGCLAGLVAPTLTGLPAAIVGVIGEIVTDIGKYLNQVPASSVKKSVPHAELTSSAIAKLHAMAARAAVVVKKARAIK